MRTNPGLFITKLNKFVHQPVSLALVLNSLPLIRNNSKDSCYNASFFSFDSFCAPHLEALVSVVRAIHSERHDISISFYCSPVCHYILSKPNCLGTFQFSDVTFQQLFHLDQGLLGTLDKSGIDKLERVTVYGSIFNSDRFKEADRLWSTLRQAFLYIEDSDHSGLFKRFPIDQFVLRDLSLTYKTTTLSDVLADQNLSQYFWLGCLVYTYLYCLESLCIPSHSFSAVFSDYAPCFTLRYSHQLANQVLRQVEMRQPYFMEPNKSNYLVIAPHNYKGILARTPDLINSLSSNVLREDVIERFFSELERRITGGKSGHVYSPNKTDRTASSYLLIQKWIGQNPGSTIFAAFTSSEDESMADSISLKYQDLNSRQLVEPVFKSHLDWILYLCEFFSTELRHCLLIIRVHPRQGADHRGLAESPTNKTLLAKLDIYAHHPNIVIVPAEENISSYCLGLQSDYILNAWSTIGFEFSMLAKPVIGAFYRTVNGSSYSFSDQPCFF